MLIFFCGWLKNLEKTVWWLGIQYFSRLTKFNILDKNKKYEVILITCIFSVLTKIYHTIECVGEYCFCYRSYAVFEATPTVSRSVKPDCARVSHLHIG